MSRLLLVVLLVVSVCMAMPAISYAETPNVIIFVQIKVRDSSGNLVSYIESTKITLVNANTLGKLLDQDSPYIAKTFMQSEGQKFEVIKINDTITQPSQTVVSQNIVSATDGKSSKVVLVAEHDGYPVVKGDVTTAYWTIIRPA
ncbi:exported hypothetical protein [Nitrosotalea sinensis]|uniref:Uncharacterized protein n=1 Tax=Nitrosotalea sinensis TaxID=1499975 RepID=A0A2H1EEF1_9ARCH|nr:hypothetical protein [Candidatus Nitrosotalea sinensis]SHO42894.1 exported hypothetical protein [Candidatus Nitrosotalea sinensis]